MKSPNNKSPLLKRQERETNNEMIREKECCQKMQKPLSFQRASNLHNIYTISFFDWLTEPEPF